MFATSPTTDVPGSDLAFAIEGISPNPALSGRMTVRCTLPSTAPATVELLDIAGRRLASRALAGVAGPQSVSLGDDVPIAPGFYWVRLRQLASETAVRAVVLR